MTYLLGNLLGTNRTTRPPVTTPNPTTTPSPFPSNRPINIDQRALIAILIELIRRLNISNNPPNPQGTLIPRNSTYPGNDNPFRVQTEASGKPSLPISARQKAAIESALGFGLSRLVDMDGSRTLTAGDVADSAAWGAAARSVRLDQAQVNAINRSR